MDWRPGELEPRSGAWTKRNLSPFRRSEKSDRGRVEFEVLQRKDHINSSYPPCGVMLSIGDASPNFENLPGVDGRRYSLDSFRDKPVLVVIFSCNHCPYVQAYEGRMVAIQRDYSSMGVQLVAINS